MYDVAAPFPVFVSPQQVDKRSQFFQAGKHMRLVLDNQMAGELLGALRDVGTSMITIRPVIACDSEKV